MSGRERVLKAINHEEPDCVPVDLGGTDLTSMMVGPYRRICAALGIDPEPIQVADTMEQCVIINDEVARKVGANTNAKVIYLLPEKWYRGEAYDGTPVQLPDGFRPETREDGARVISDDEGNPAMVMPAGGFFFDVGYHPLKDARTVADFDRYSDQIKNFDRPGWCDMPLEKMADYARELKQTEDKLLVGAFAGHIFQAGQILRGWSDFLLDLAERPAFAEALLDRVTEGHMEAYERYAETVGKEVDVIEVTDDLGIQTGLWVSPDTYRKHIKPYQAKLYAHIKQKTGKPILLHSDGSLFPIIPDLIEMGVDILNPIQYSAKDMGLSKLKKEFGNDLCFWGAGIDTQSVLPFGTPEEVADEVKRNIDILAPGGGFIFGTIHNITEGVPTENILAAFRTAADYGQA